MERMRKTAGVISRVGLQGWLHSSPVELAFSACFSFYTKDTGTHKTAGPMLAMTWNEVTVSTFVQHRVMPCQPLFTQANSVFSSTAFPPVKNLVTAESLLCKGIWEMWFFLCSIWLLDGSGKKKKNWNRCKTNPSSLSLHPYHCLSSHHGSWKRATLENLF